MTAIGTVERDGDDLLWRLSGARPGVYWTAAGGVPALVAGGSAVLYGDDGWPVGTVGTSASLLMLIGQFREAGAFVYEPDVFAVAEPSFMVPRARVRAHYWRDDGPVPVLACGGA
jgi:hypothetical protein